MRDLYFLFPTMSIESGGHLAQMRLLETAKRVTPAHAVVYESRDGNVPFLDDVLQQADATNSIFVIHCGFHVPDLIHRLIDKNVVYLSYSTGYSLHPFANLAKRSYHLPGSAQMIVSDLDSTATREWIRLHSPAAPFVWVAKQALDEAATDALYEATPFVYVLPNFLPRYVRREFVHHLRKIWKVASVHTLKSAWRDPASAGVDLAGR